MSSGYIYVRQHSSYDAENAFKLGKASNIPERDTQYATGEIRRGIFNPVFEVPIEIMGDVERKIQENFRAFNIRYDAGTEFYNKSIIDEIQPFLIQNNIPHKKLTFYEIMHLVRPLREKKIIIKKTHISEKKQPRNDQYILINKSGEYFQTCDKGVLVLVCGIGKTLISLWIASQKLGAKTLLIGVPNTQLLQQWKQTVCEIYKNTPILLVYGGISIENISRFLGENACNCIVITTYASSHKVFAAVAVSSQEMCFDFKILDECHHLTTRSMEIAGTTKTYIEILHIPAKKQLALTATLKQLSVEESTGLSPISNDDIEHFGNVIEKKSVLWGIQEDIICDYVIQTIVSDDAGAPVESETEKRLWLSAYVALKSIYDGHSHHLLIYANSTENAEKINSYITEICIGGDAPSARLYHSNYDSTMSETQQDEILKQFKSSCTGIIICVYCLGEGWDFPLLDGVVFAENMTSNIRIVQSALRASRKNRATEPNKIMKIILPILNTTENDWLGDIAKNPDFKKAREVIYQMGAEDETISQKIKVYKLNTCDFSQDKPRTIEKTNISYDPEITEQLLLKTVHRIALGTSYEKARKIIADTVPFVNSKRSYYELCDRDNRLSKEPEIIYRGQFTNWIDYLGIERVYYDIEMCRTKVIEYIKLNPELKKYYLEQTIICEKLCETDANFPPSDLWTDYYKVGVLSDIICITAPFGKKKSKGAIK